MSRPRHRMAPVRRQRIRKIGRRPLHTSHRLRYAPTPHPVARQIAPYASSILPMGLLVVLGMAFEVPTVVHGITDYWSAAPKREFVHAPPRSVLLPPPPSFAAATHGHAPWSTPVADVDMATLLPPPFELPRLNSPDPATVVHHDTNAHDASPPGAHPPGDSPRPRRAPTPHPGQPTHGGWQPHPHPAPQPGGGDQGGTDDGGHGQHGGIGGLTGHVLSGAAGHSHDSDSSDSGSSSDDDHPSSPHQSSSDSGSHDSHQSSSHSGGGHGHSR